MIPRTLKPSCYMQIYIKSIFYNLAIQAYPNPTDGKLFIDMHQATAGNYSLHIMNAFGERQHVEKFIPLCMKKLLNNEKILYNKSLNKENYVLLSMKPQAVGEITISNSEYIQGLTEITSNDTLTEITANSPNDYFIWLVLVGVLIIIIVIVVIIIMRKIKK